MTTTPMHRSSGQRERDKAPIPAAVAAFFAVARDTLRKVEDAYKVERYGSRRRESRTWELEFVTDRDETDGVFIAECPQLPGAMAQGETEQEAVDSLADVVSEIIAMRVHRRLAERRTDMSSVNGVHVVTISLT